MAHMTEEQFEALGRWIEAAAQAVQEGTVHGHTPALKDLAKARDEAYRLFVGD